MGIVGVIGLFVYASLSTKQARTFWENTNIPCLSGGHTNALQHIHQNVSIMVDGVSEKIPGNIGINSLCMAEVHTHEADGRIHVETAQQNKNYTLGDFFTVWGKPFIRDGYVSKITVNGVSVETPTEVPLRDHDMIVISYTSQS